MRRTRSARRAVSAAGLDHRTPARPPADRPPPGGRSPVARGKPVAPRAWPSLGRVLVVIPAYREADNVGAVVRRVREVVRADVVVVDDCSPDATGDVARAAGATVVRHPINLRYGGAVQTGFKYAVRHGYDCVVQMDADGQHEPSDVATLLDALVEFDADVAIGSRFLGTRSYRVPALRRAGMRLFGAIATLAIGQRVSDPTSGFQALRRPVVEFFATDVYPVDYPDADVIVMLHRNGFRIAEVPVRMYANPTNTSMHSGLLNPLYYVFKMSLSMLVTLLREKRPMRGALGRI